MDEGRTRARKVVLSDKINCTELFSVTSIGITSALLPWALQLPSRQDELLENCEPYLSVQFILSLST